MEDLRIWPTSTWVEKQSKEWRTPVTKPGCSRSREERKSVENRNDSGHFGFAAIKLVLELVKHDAEAEGDTISDHVDEERSSNDDPTKAAVRGTRETCGGGGGA